MDARLSLILGGVRSGKSDFADACALHGIPHRSLRTLDELIVAFVACLDRSGPEVLEVVTDSAATHRRVREIRAAITDRIPG